MTKQDKIALIIGEHVPFGLERYPVQIILDAGYRPIIVHSDYSNNYIRMLKGINIANIPIDKANPEDFIAALLADNFDKKTYEVEHPKIINLLKKFEERERIVGAICNSGWLIKSRKNSVMAIKENKDACRGKFLHYEANSGWKKEMLSNIDTDVKRFMDSLLNTLGSPQE